ncbi:MAG: chemotaxis protein CheC [Methanosarcinaceae archaeon]|nr:chemotaxis protein CheC [Methanosarcinaceae archaeon]
MTELDEMTKGAFQEAGNIGMGHLATALSNMVGREVKINIPIVKITPLENIQKEASEGANKSVVAIHIPFSGDVSGGTLLLLPKYSAFSFSDLLLKRSVGTTNKIEQKEINKLKDMGSRLCGAYMNVVNEFLGTNLHVGDPEVHVNMDGVGDFIEQEIGKLADEFIVVGGEATIPITRSKHEFNMLFEPEASDVILAAVMKKMMG